MPEFIAVQCFQCNHYQVAQPRRDRKFTCKLCGCKQSVRKKPKYHSNNTLPSVTSLSSFPCFCQQIVARSNKAADLRKFVQNINLTRGKAEERFEQLTAPHLANADPHPRPHQSPSDENIVQNLDSSQAPSSSHEFGRQRHRSIPSSHSKWAQYESVLLEKAASQPHADGNRQPSCINQWQQASDDEYTTLLPDKISRASRKRKRHARGAKQSPTPPKRNSLTDRQRPNDDAHGHEASTNRHGARWEPTRDRQSCRTSPSLTSGGHSRRWGEDSDVGLGPPPKHRNVDVHQAFVEGTITTLGGDEPVEEDVAY